MVLVKMEQLGSASTAPDSAPPTSNPMSTPAPSNASNGMNKDSQSPSPSPATSNGQGGSSRRPPRKSTLTQQQKNQKRQRATQDQLATLELEFDHCPTPSANVRERIAEEINMTERSVQIWFQNRRAKIKLLAKRSIETGEDIDSIPESMRAYLAIQAMESGQGRGVNGTFIGRTGLVPHGYSMMLGGEQGGQNQKVVIHHLTCRSLAIGRWTRVGQNTMDLIVFYSPEKSTITYYINNDQSGYKIEYPFNAIKNIYLDNPEGDSTKSGGIVIELNRPPNFYMDAQQPTSNGFFMCGDFTEHQQATQCLVHQLGGNPKVLAGQLAKLVSLESFMNRHNTPHPYLEQPMTMSAPVSPSNRPSSQPNFAQPHVGMFQQEQWGINPGHASMRGGPGHKRQRSRSMPAPVDYSIFQGSMPSFYVNEPHPQSPAMFSSPVPQQPHHLGPVGPNLRIDTQAGYGLDMRQYPLSAATTAPSEYSSPNYYPQVAQTPLPESSYNTPYSSTFLSPMVGHSSLAPPPVSPLSYHGDSAIEQSPTMGMMRSASADIYGDSAVSDDGQSLNEMYSKHTIDMPMHPHSPAYMAPGQQDLDMNQLVQFDHMDHASMSPEHLQAEHMHPDHMSEHMQHQQQ